MLVREQSGFASPGARGANSMNTCPEEGGKIADTALLSAIAAGDDLAFEQLYDRYSAMVFRVAFRILKNRELAEEMVQEAFWRVWRRSASFERERGSVAQWLFGITHNLCIDELRRMRARPNTVADDNLAINRVIDDQIDIPGSAIASERHDVLRSALEILPESQREAVEMMYLNGLSQQEIANRLNRPLGTIKTRVRLGLQKLHTIMTARGLLSSDAC